MVAMFECVMAAPELMKTPRFRLDSSRSANGSAAPGSAAVRGIWDMRSARNINSRGAQNTGKLADCQWHCQCQPVTVSESLCHCQCRTVMFDFRYPILDSQYPGRFLHVYLGTGYPGMCI